MYLLLMCYLKTNFLIKVQTLFWNNFRYSSGTKSVEPTNTAAYHPASNGLAEDFVHTLERELETNENIT